MTHREVITLGCRLNSYESEVIQAHLDASELEDVVVINSCAVTQEAERQAKQIIRRKRMEHPNAKIIVTGCAAQINPDRYIEMEQVDQVIGNDEKMKAQSYLSTESLVVNDIMSVKETAMHLVEGFDKRSRAFVQIQNGCNHRCTFCIIPYGRGNSRSVGVGEVVNQVRRLVANGYREIVLTGVDISDYGKDLPGQPSLGELVKRLLNLIPELPRIRLSSIDVAEIDNDIYELIAHEPRFMPYLHISLQAGDDMILKRMKRRHTRQQVIDFCDEVRRLRPEMSFGADIIAGFPTETDAMFNNSLRLVEEAGLQFLHVFPYSAREGTPAARMPQLPKAVRKERAQRLRQAGEIQLQRFLESKSGQEAAVLIENNNLGRCEDFSEVQLCNDYPVGEIVPMQLVVGEGLQMKEAE